jgi:hypothetical protein
MSRAISLPRLERQAFDVGVSSGETQQQRAGRKGGKATAAQRRTLIRRLNPFGFMLANAVMHEPRRRGTPSAADVRALTDRHQVALASTLKHRKIPHTRGASPYVTAPFLLAGFYLARMLHQLTRPGGGPQGFSRIRYEGQTALEQRSASVAYDLFPTSAADRRAWWENCARAGDYLEGLTQLPGEFLALVGRCGNPACLTTFFFTRGPRAPRACGGACRQALFRGRASRRRVTIQRSKRKVLGVSAPPTPRRSPVISRPAAR